jgi:hypothetical protein
MSWLHSIILAGRLRLIGFYDAAFVSVFRRVLCAFSEGFTDFSDGR